MIPVQYWLLNAAGVDATLSIRLALGTNLMVIIPTSLNGTISHHKKGAVLWTEGILLGITGMLGAYFGAIIATHLPEHIMTLILGIFVISVGVNMLVSPPAPKTTLKFKSNIFRCLWLGIPLGTFCGILGMAGGAIMVPLMMFVLKISIHQAIATSMLVMIFSAVGGALSFIVHGLGVEGLPAYSTGYINWLQWLLLAGCSIPMAAVGARAAHKLPSQQIKLVFVSIMFLIGLKITGILELVPHLLGSLLGKITFQDVSIIHYLFPAYVRIGSITAGNLITSLRLPNARH